MINTKSNIKPGDKIKVVDCSEGLNNYVGFTGTVTEVCPLKDKSGVPLGKNYIRVLLDKLPRNHYQVKLDGLLFEFSELILLGDNHE